LICKANINVTKNIAFTDDRTHGSGEEGIAIQLASYQPYLVRGTVTLPSHLCALLVVLWRSGPGLYGLRCLVHLMFILSGCINVSNNFKRISSQYMYVFLDKI
jgi:hypothetical protein